MPELELSIDLRNYLQRLPEVDLTLLVESWGKPLPEAFRVNTLKLDEEEILSRLRRRGIKFKKIPWTRHGYIAERGVELGTTIEHSLGLIYLQGPVSMAPVEALDPKPGDIVLDMCAAPGSKSTQIAQFLRGEGVLVSNDINLKRSKALSSNLQRFGVLNAVLTALDGRAFPRLLGEYFDKVLVDAPCSSLGVVSKDWSVARNWKLRQALRLSKLQRQLIKAGFDSLKPGGILVYATCTLTVEENEFVINYLLERRENAVLEEPRLEGLKSRPGVTSWNGIKLHSELKKTLRILPYDNDAEGFYIAVIRKER